MVETNGLGSGGEGKRKREAQVSTESNVKEFSLISLDTGCRLLEVGAVRPDNYGDCTSWIDVTAIDLHSRHPSILEQDFLLMDTRQHYEAWDIISLSLVLNFVPGGKDRGMPILRNS